MGRDDVFPGFGGRACSLGGDLAACGGLTFRRRCIPLRPARHPDTNTKPDVRSHPLRRLLGTDAHGAGLVSLFAAPQTWPFGAALALIVAVALVEGIGMLAAISPSNTIDGWLPEIGGDGGLDSLLGWLHIGRVPTLVLLVLFLAGYAVFGYSLQAVVHALSGHYLPAWAGAVAAVPPGLATVRSLGALVERIVPRDESSAVSEQSLVGRAGLVSGGTARRGLAAQARVKDTHGRSHYLMVEPELDDEVFEEGTEILVVRKAGAFYRCVAKPPPGVVRI